MIKLILFIISFNALMHFCLSATEKPNPGDNKLPHSEISNINVSKLNSSLRKSNNSPGESKLEVLKQAKDESKSKAATDSNKTVDKLQNKTEDSAKILPSLNGSEKMEQESRFLTTVSMVFISMSLLFMVFVAFKTYRRKSRNARIKKYGIRLARGNIEMTPLPLDNDDDDETIFDLKNLPT